MLFGRRKRSEAFEWRENVRSTAKDRGVDAGLAGVGAVREGAAAADQRAGQTIAGAAVAGAGLVAGGARCG